MDKRGGVLGVLISVVLLAIIGLILYAVIGMTEKLDEQVIADIDDTVEPAIEPAIVESELDAESETSSGFEDLTQEQQNVVLEVKDIDETNTAEDCESTTLKDQCYINLAIAKNDKSLCEKINEERYKTICLEN